MQDTIKRKTKNSKRPASRPLKQGKALTLMLLGVICILLIGNICCKPDIVLYPGGQDVLNPSPEVLANPHGVTEDGFFKISAEFMEWVQQLQIEINRLRKLIK